MHNSLPMGHEEVKRLLELFAIPVVYHQALLIFLRYLYGNRIENLEENIGKRRSELRNILLHDDDIKKITSVHEHIWNDSIMELADNSSPFRINKKNHGKGKTYNHVDFDSGITAFKAGKISWYFQSEIYNTFRLNMINENRARSGINIFGQYVGGRRPFVGTEEMSRYYLNNVYNETRTAYEHFQTDPKFFRKAPIKDW